MKTETITAQPISSAYDWREIGKILALFYSPLLPLVATMVVWVLIDKDSVKQMMTVDMTNVLVTAAVLIGMLLVLKYISVRNKIYELTWVAFGLKKAPVGRSIKYFLGFFGMVVITILALAVVAVLLLGDKVAEPASAMRGTKTVLNWVFLLAGGVIIGPISEEIVFRGVLFGFLHERHRFIVAAILSSLVFMLIHLNPVAFVTALPLGLYLCFMYKRLGSIVPGMVVHMLWNFMVTMIK
jgi:membrane protease YdiL (CAAX protease family)